MKIGIVGSDTLIGRDLRDLIGERNIKATVQLLSSGEQVITSDQEEPIVLGALTPDELADVDIILLAGDAASSRRALEASPKTATLIDLTGALEDEPDARLTGDGGTRPLRIVPHAAALIIARVLEALHQQAAIRHAVVTIFGPASEHGQEGMTELQQQTSNLLSLRPLDQKIFDAQAAFNMLPRYGAEAAVSLESIEHRIERHVATLLGGALPQPSLRLLQVPVFHGYAVSFWIELDSVPDVDSLTAHFVTSGLDVRDQDVEPASHASVAGNAGIATGPIERDRNDQRAIWVYAVADNFRMTVDAAIDAVEELAR